MTNLFEMVISLSVKGGAAALGVWLVCQLLHRLNAPRQLCRVLWLAVFLRLICPVGIPVALPQAAALPAQWEETASEETLFSQTAPLPVGESGAQTAAGPSAGALLTLGWAAGAAGLGLYALWEGRKLARRVALACRTPEGYYTGEGVDTPFVWGMFRPRIYLPAGLDPDTCTHVLTHERAHLRQLDFLLKPLCYAVVCLHWFNPLAWLAYRQFALECEAACDQAALARMDPARRGEYCRSLVRFAMTPSLTLQPLALGQSNVKARVKAILAFRKPAAWALVLALALALGAGLACFAQPVTQDSPVPAAESPAKETAVPAPEAALALPVAEYNYVSCRYGGDESLGTFHKGLDLAAEEGTPVLAAASGLVTQAQYHWSYGNFVEVDHGDGLTTLYAHLDTLTVEEGQTVTAGQQLGTVGRTGNVTGDCLHFEVRENGTVTDPEHYLNLES